METSYSISNQAAPSAPETMVDDSPAGLIARWTTLIGEYEAFQELLRVRARQPCWPGVRPYINTLQIEARQSDKLGERAAQGEAETEAWRGQYRLAVTTLAAKEGMWRMIKTCRGIMGLDRRLSTMSKQQRKKGQQGQQSRQSQQSQQSQQGQRLATGGGRSEGEKQSNLDVFVNAVVDNGREWLRVLTPTNTHYMIELAENGWGWEEADADEEDTGKNDDDDELADISEMSLVKTALELIKAAVVNRCKGAYPRICIVLTRIDEAVVDDVELVDDDEEDKERQRAAVEIGRFLQKARRGLAAYTTRMPPDIDGRRLRVEIHSARAPRTNARPPPGSLDETLHRMLPDLSDRLTPTLNIDLSILISLTSDIAHDAVASEPWHPRERSDEIAREATQPGKALGELINNVLRGRRLVCTQEAAAAFRVMVHDMAQPSEKERARCLLVWGDVEDDSGDPVAADRPALLSRFRALSRYADAIPDDLMLPIEVQDAAWDLDRIQTVCQPGGQPPQYPEYPDEELSSSPPQPCLPAVAYPIALDMTAAASPTLSVFMCGWAMGYTTITTNLMARNYILRRLERYRTSSYEPGPLVWVFRTARSLNGTNPKDGRRDGKDRGE
ncbi:MAG: hypothetical protein STHCBS139747_005011 [Sporothrix thermara]